MIRRTLGGLLRRAAPRTMRNLSSLSELEASPGGLGGRLEGLEQEVAGLRTQLSGAYEALAEASRRVDGLVAELDELRDETDETRVNQRRAAELHDLVFERLRSQSPL